MLLSGFQFYPVTVCKKKESTLQKTFVNASRRAALTLSLFFGCPPCGVPAHLATRRVDSPPPLSAFETFPHRRTRLPNSTPTGLIPFRLLLAVSLSRPVQCISALYLTYFARASVCLVSDTCIRALWYFPSPGPRNKGLASSNSSGLAMF